MYFSNHINKKIKIFEINFFSEMNVLRRFKKNINKVLYVKEFDRNCVSLVNRMILSLSFDFFSIFFLQIFSFLLYYYISFNHKP